MKFSIFFLFAVLSVLANAQELTDSERANALKDTQAFLRNSADRNAAIAKDPKQKEADDKVTSLVGSGQNKEDMYEISAQVMEKLVNETGGDNAKMQTIMENAQKNPQGFYNTYMNDAQKAKVSDLATKASNTTTTVPASH